MPKKKGKGRLLLLVLLIVAGLGLYFAYTNNDIGRLPPVTSGSTLAELWETNWEGHTHPPSASWCAKCGSLTTAAQAAQTTQPSQTTAAGSSSAPGTTTTATTTTATTKPDSTYAYAREYGLYPAEANMPADRYLICVNRSRALPAKYRVSLAVCVENIYPENRMMETQAARQYRKMYDAALKEDNTMELIPFSAYRSTAQQKAAFDREVKALEDAGLGRQEAIERALLSIQLPGCSEHETGLAIDITRKGVWATDPGFDGTKEFRWLEKHAQEYGFILRYPKGKLAITGVGYEPWHWRYVGVENAKKIKESGQCLEEYLGIQ